MTKEEIYDYLRDMLLSLVQTRHWTNAELDITIQPKHQRIGAYVVEEGGTRSVLSLSSNPERNNLIFQLHDLTTDNGANKWNKMKFLLYPDRHYEVQFNWDQAMQDQSDANNRQLEQTVAGYKAPKWKWEQ